MTKKMTVLLVCMLLLSALVLPVSAQMGSYVTDQAGLLLPEEIASLEEKASALSADYGIDAVILTVDSLDGQRAQNYADDYYDNHGYRDDGVLFLLTMAEREWYISTSGSMIYTLTDYGIQQVGENVVACFAEGYWYTGLYQFLDQLSYYLDAYESGAPIDGYADYSGDYYHGDQEEVVYYEKETYPNFFYSLLAGLAAAGISLGVMRSSMNTKRSQRNAGAYLEEGTWNLYQHRDLFLYSNVTKPRRQQSSSGGGGGSSVHRSSGGRRHGGGGGKF